MKQIIRLTESDLHKLIGESVKSILKETSWQLSDRAAEKAQYGSIDWWHINNQLEDILMSLEDADVNTLGGQARDMIASLQKAKAFAQRKTNQVDNLDSLNKDNFANQHNGQSEKEFRDNIDAKYDEWWNQHKDDEDRFLDDGFTDTLNDKEQEYYNEKM